MIYDESSATLRAGKILRQVVQCVRIQSSGGALSSSFLGCSPALRMRAANVSSKKHLLMSSTVTSHPDRRSLDYALRSGLAGGLAGCIVRTPVFSWCYSYCDFHRVFGRQKPPSHLSIESKFFFKPLTPTFRSMQVWAADVSASSAR